MTNICTTTRTVTLTPSGSDLVAINDPDGRTNLATAWGYGSDGLLTSMTEGTGNEANGVHPDERRLALRR